jgi:hypothetical protein
VHWIIHIHQTAPTLSLCIIVAKTDFPSRINTVTPESPWQILSQRRQPTENLGYINHFTPSSSSIFCGLTKQIFVQVHVDELYQLAWFIRFFRTNSISFKKMLHAIVTFLQINTHNFSNFRIKIWQAKSLNFTFVWPCIVTDFFYNKTN